MPQESIQWNVGDVILDLYQVTDSLGEGGFGKVYKVRHLGWNIDLAVKIPKPAIVAAAGGVESFQREAETWVNLGLHPHTVSCYYVRRIDGNPVVFAEYVAGGSLADWISDGRLYAGGERASLKRILDIAIQFAWGLHYAHEKGLIHQDVKPANVMMTPDGVVKVTDFGLAKGKIVAAMQEPPNLVIDPLLNSPVFKEVSEEWRTLVATLRGMTPAYCSLEQASGEILTRRCDMWSWGLSVLEMFSGERTWRYGGAATELLAEYLCSQSQNPHLPQMPKSVVALLQRCFRKNPHERHRNMLVLAKELQGSYEQLTREPYPRKQPRAGEDIADSLNNRAVSLVDLGKPEEALHLWEKALQMQPQHLESTYNRGLILWRMGRIKDDTPVKEVERVRQSHAGNWMACYFLSLLHLERDDCEAAIKTLEAIPGEEAQALYEGEDATLALKGDSPNATPVRAALKLARERLPNSKRLLRTFKGHTHSVRSVCLSGDARLALSGSWDKTLKLWEVSAGRLLRTFEGHADCVRSVCLSPDGCLALSGSSDKTLKLWEVSAGRLLRTFNGHTHSVRSVCLSADARLALSGSEDKTLKLWEVSEGRLLRTFEGHADCVRSVCLSGDGSLALSGSSDKTLKLWEVSTGRLLRTFNGHTHSVRSVCLNADARLALSGSEDDTLKLWEVSTGRLLRTFEGHASVVTSVSLNRDGTIALSGSWDNTFKLWDVTEGRLLRTFEGHTEWVRSVCLSPDGRFALSGSDDSTLKLWQIGPIAVCAAPLVVSRVLATETILELCQTYEREMALAQAAAGQGDWAAAAAHLRTARAQPGYSRRSEAVKAWASLYVHLPRKAFMGGWESAALAGHTDEVYSGCLSSDGSIVLSGSRDSTLKLWDLASGRLLRTFEEHAEPVYSVCLSQDARLALSGSRDKSLKLWDVVAGRCLRTFKGHTGYVSSVCLSGDGRLALSGSGDATLKLWDAATGSLLRTFEGHADSVFSVCLSGDGTLALSGSRDKTLKLWDVTAGLCLRTFEGHTGWVLSVCLSGDGTVAVSGSVDNTLKLWDVAGGRCLRTFERDAGVVNSVCLSGDGSIALSGSDDRTVQLWDVATGRLLRTFEGHADSVNSVILSGDGRFALSGSADNTLKLWVLDWDLEHRHPADWDQGQGRRFALD
jgi:WD40 repeat protein/serine/threonine protein kinase